VPLLALSAASCAVTVWAQNQGGAFGALTGISLSTRLANAAISYVAYLRQTFMPVDLAPFYPYPVQGPETVTVVGAVGFLTAVTALAVWWRGRRPYLIVGWLWYLGALVPVIGLIQVGGQSRADRYTYLPLVGIFVAVVWAGAEFAARLGRVRSAAWLAGAVLAYLMLLSWTQAHYWHDSIALWEHSLQVTRSNVVAHLSLGQALFQQDQVDDAVRHFRTAAQLNPRYAPAHNDLGKALEKQGRIDEAVAQFREAARLDPSKAFIHLNLGLALQRQGHLREAVASLRQAVAYEPNRAEYHRSLGHALYAQSRAADARAEYQESLRLDPDWPFVLTRRVMKLASDPDPRRRDGRRALYDAEQILQATGDNNPKVLALLAAAQAELRHFDEATATARRARQLAEAAGQTSLARQIESQIRLYEQQQPFRTAAP
jgi:Flp pilus assembly protein TadD